MTRDELYSKITALVPVKVEEKDEFRVIVRKALAKYLELLDNLKDAEKPDRWAAALSRVKRLCDAINRAIEMEYRGTRHSSFTAIKNQLNGYMVGKQQIKKLSYNVISVPIGTVSFRMRKMGLEEQNKIKRKDLFHIPLDKKGLVETQRYSVPGYPCLYLAHSVYGCWEEMGRPEFGTVMVSRFVTQREFKVLDLRVPSKQTWEDGIENCVQFFPFVISSMVQVKNSQEHYKPEYLVPQLLTEWVISRNRDNNPDQDKIVGIIYTSAQKNTDFDFPDDCVDNYAIPVLNPLSNEKYCPQLRAIFKMSAPTYYDLEVLKNGQVLDAGHFGLDEKEQKAENLRLSRFGEMEELLKDKDMCTIKWDGSDGA